MPRVLLSSVPFAAPHATASGPHKLCHMHTKTNDEHYDMTPQQQLRPAQQSQASSQPPEPPEPPEPSPVRTTPPWPSVLAATRARLGRIAIQNTKLHQRCVKRLTLAQQTQQQSNNGAPARPCALRRTRSSPALLPRPCSAASSACNTATHASCCDDAKACEELTFPAVPSRSPPLAHTAIDPLVAPTPSTTVSSSPTPSAPQSPASPGKTPDEQ